MFETKQPRSLKRTRTQQAATTPVAYRITLLAVLFALLCCSSSAWSPSHTTFSTSSRRNRIPQTQKPETPSHHQQQPLTSQHMLKTTAGVSNTNPREKVKLSHSVLASCDTLPSFPTAHGLLSPETVMQLEEFQHTDRAVARFLHMYHSHGPLSCVPMLGDPAILPHLTSAMRKIAV